LSATPRKAFFNTTRSPARRRSQASDRITPFFYHLSHQLEDAAYLRLLRQIRRQLVGRHIELHRGAQKTLQQSIVQFLSDARPLSQSFFKSDVQPRGNLPQSQTKERECRKHQHNGATDPEPPRLPEQRLYFEGQRGFIAVPLALAVARYDRAPVKTRAQIGIYVFPRRHRAAPVLIESIEPVSEPDLLGNRQTQSSIAECDPLTRAGNLNSPMNINRDAIRTNAF